MAIILIVSVALAGRTAPHRVAPIIAAAVSKVLRNILLIFSSIVTINLPLTGVGIER